MSDKINKYKWLPWAIAVAVVIVIGILGSGYTNWYILEPWTVASNLISEISIKAFGKGVKYNAFAQDAEFYWDLRLISLVTILLTFVVGPSLWVYAEVKNQVSNPENVLKKGLVWYIGVVLVVASLQVVPTAIIKGIVFQNTWDSAAQREVKDLLRSDLMKLGYDVLELYHLPNEFGGGSGSFQVVNADGEANSLQLSNLESYSKLSKFSYTMTPLDSDSAVKIHGVSDYDGADANFKNSGGAVGKLQMDLEVRPPASFDFKEVNAR